MLHTSPSPFWVCIWFAKFTWWRHDSTYLYRKEVTWWKWYFTFWVTDGLHSEWSRVNDKLSFNHQCSEWFIIQKVTVGLLQSFQNSSCKSNWRSQTPLIWETPSGLLCYRIQSAPFSCKTLLILSCFISLNARCNSFLAPTKFVPLSDQIERTVLLLAIMNLRSAKMKELASKVTLMCTARLEKHVKRAP